jgi:hypothetical protein
MNDQSEKKTDKNENGSFFRVIFLTNNRLNFSAKYFEP